MPDLPSVREKLLIAGAQAYLFHGIGGQFQNLTDFEHRQRVQRHRSLLDESFEFDARTADFLPHLLRPARIGLVHRTAQKAATASCIGLCVLRGSSR